MKRMDKVEKESTPVKINDYFLSPGKKNGVDNGIPKSQFPTSESNSKTNVEKASQNERREINRETLAINSPRAKMNKKKKLVETRQDNKLLTDYFPVRRSSRKPKSELEKEKKSCNRGKSTEKY